MRLYRLKLALGLLYVAVTAAEQLHFSVQHFEAATKKGINDEVRRLAQDLLQNATIPGLSLGIVHSNGVVEMEAFGIRNEDGDAMATETLTTIASCSKAFLASSVGILMDDFARGKNVTSLPRGVKSFDWHSKVKDILPADWKLMDHWANEKATFQDILSHQSGMPSHDFSYHPQASARDVVRNLRHLRPAFELRQRYHYTNQMYMLAAHVIATYSGMSYPEFVNARIFTPLNMSTSSFSISEALETGLLTQSWTKFGRRLPSWFQDEKTGDLLAGAGGVISSVDDLTKWVRMLLNGGVEPVTNKTIIPPSVLDLTTSAISLVYPKAPIPWLSIYGYGLGWSRVSYQGHEIVLHNGGLPGVSTQVILVPGQKIGVVVLANADEKQGQEMAVAFRVIEDLLGLPRKASVHYASMKPAQAANVPKPRQLEQGQASPSLRKYTGVYSSPGYPNITICDPKSSKAEPACQDTLYQFSFLDDLSASHNTLYSSIPSVWASHIRYTLDYNDTFRTTFAYLFPHGYGKDKTPFETSETGTSYGTATFVVKDGHAVGFAMNGLAGMQTESQRLGGSVQETAEAWYTRLG